MAAFKETPLPTEIKLHQVSRLLEISFDDGKTFRLPCEFLRVYSPSAEVRGHGPGQEVLQVGKREILINSAEPVCTPSGQAPTRSATVSVVTAAAPPGAQPG